MTEKDKETALPVDLVEAAVDVAAKLFPGELARAANSVTPLARFAHEHAAHVAAVLEASRGVNFWKNKDVEAARTENAMLVEHLHDAQAELAEAQNTITALRGHLASSRERVSQLMAEATDLADARQSGTRGGGKMRLAKAAALHDACREYMEANGVCGDADVDGEATVCIYKACVYCNLCRAAQPGMYPDATGGESDGK